MRWGGGGRGEETSFLRALLVNAALFLANGNLVKCFVSWSAVAKRASSDRSSLPRTRGTVELLFFVVCDHEKSERAKRDPARCVCVWGGGGSCLLLILTHCFSGCEKFEQGLSLDVSGRPRNNANLLIRWDQLDGRQKSTPKRSPSFKKTMKTYERARTNTTLFSYFSR